MQETFADEGLSYSMGGKTGSTLVSDGHIFSSCVNGPSWMALTILTHWGKDGVHAGPLACAPAELAQARCLGAGAGRAQGAGCPR